MPRCCFAPCARGHHPGTDSFKLLHEGQRIRSLNACILCSRSVPFSFLLPSVLFHPTYATVGCSRAASLRRFYRSPSLGMARAYSNVVRDISRGPKRRFSRRPSPAESPSHSHVAHDIFRGHQRCCPCKPKRHHAARPESSECSRALLPAISPHGGTHAKTQIPLAAFASRHQHPRRPGAFTPPLILSTIFTRTSPHKFHRVHVLHVLPPLAAYLVPSFPVG
ncbi:hypothetical protein B0H19DRAFT_1156406 [Mycena capillaripes]|nr:hypothetical protein B0H19DRAFT_1156406 [Mycena capillaripes]